MKHTETDDKNKIISLNERVLSIQKGEGDADQFISEFRPFIMSTASKVTGEHIDDQKDEMSIALLAFNEAVQHYNAAKGSFLAFSALVIRRRLIDYMRRRGRINQEIAYSELSESQKIYYDNQYIEPEGIENPIVLEIYELDEVLERYNISFDELVMASPKAFKTKLAIEKIVKYMASDTEAIDEMKRKKQLPIKKICDKCIVPRKLVERHRKYIVTVIEILIGDYPFLRDYISYAKEVKK
ncbi:MAG: RNA polymerase sigma-I factor [Eubacteriales bacterium]